MTLVSQSTSNSNWFKRRQKDIAALGSDALKRWYVYLPVAFIWILAANRLLVDPTPHVPLLFNWTSSLPYKAAWMSQATMHYERGDFVVFRFEGKATTFYPGLKHQPFFKIIKGIAGDRITIKDRQVFINDVFVGYAKRYAFDGRPLEPIAEGVIPAGYFYVQGTDHDSFDSRYRSSGLIRADQIIGRVTPLF